MHLLSPTTNSLYRVALQLHFLSLGIPKYFLVSSCRAKEKRKLNLILIPFYEFYFFFLTRLLEYSPLALIFSNLATVWKCGLSTGPLNQHEFLSTLHIFLFLYLCVLPLLSSLCS